MRERSTWHKNGNETPRQAATSRRADVYTMNQEHPQPSPTEYESGSPDSWAETPVSGDKMNVNDEYDGDHVKRNEIGLGEFRDDTWKHKDSDKWGGSGKYDNAKVAAERKAQAAEFVARRLVRSSDEKLIENVALEFMSLPDRSLVATVKLLNQASPSALPQDARLRRALACTKLAARTLGSKATEAHVEKLASLYMNVDDPTLKGMLKVVASVHVAQQQEQQEEEQQGETAQEEEKEDKPETQQAQEQSTSQQQSTGQEQQEEQQEVTSQEQQESCMPASDLALLDQLLQHEQAEHGGAPTDDLSALFGAPAAPMAAPAAPAAPMPAVASDISFDEEEGEGRTASGDDLDTLFADDPEVAAQRQIRASAQEQATRAGNFQVGRTASTGAKKIGQVIKAGSASIDKTLEALWDKP